MDGAIEATALPQFSSGMRTVYADMNRVRAGKLGISPDKIIDALPVYLGSAYISDFNYLGCTHEVMAQADGGPAPPPTTSPGAAPATRAAAWCRSGRLHDSIT